VRSTDERLAAVERRVSELKQQKKQRMYRFISLSAIAACLVVVVGISIAMPGIMEGLYGGYYINTGMMASIFYQGKALGYIIIGLLSFALGVCVTVLCFILRPERRNNKGEHNDGRNN
jgi:predicted lysophospholipase L1 biosynthesis ABC-type transport system permease subunit